MGNHLRLCAVVCLFFVTLSASSTAFAKTFDLIITSDCGNEIDDQWALVYAMLSPELHVKAYISSLAPNFKEPSAEITAQCIRDVLKATKTKARLFTGSSLPLASETAPRETDGARFIIRESRRYSSAHRLIVMPIGPVTDLASALLMDKTLQDRIEIWMMGFGQWPQGGDEWNVAVDRDAANVILRSRAPLVVLSAEVSMRDLDLTEGQMTSLLATRRDAISQWLYKYTMDYLKPKDWYHGHKVYFDVGTLGVLFGMSENIALPRPYLKPDFSFGFPDPSRGVLTWVKTLDSKRLWADFGAKLDRKKGD